MGFNSENEFLERRGHSSIESYLTSLSKKTNIPYEEFKKISEKGYRVASWNEKGIILKGLNINEAWINENYPKVKEVIEVLAEKLNVKKESLESLFKQGYLVFVPEIPRRRLFGYIECTDAREHVMREEGFNSEVVREHQAQIDALDDLCRPKEERYLSRWLENK